MGGHFDIYLWLFSPLVYLFGNYTLLIIQIASVIVGMYGTYCLVRLCKATVRRIPVQALDDYMTRDMSMSNEEMLRKADLLLLEMDLRRSRRGR